MLFYPKSHKITHECKMEMWNAFVFCSSELFPSDAILRTAEKSCHILRDEAVEKAVSYDCCPQATKSVRQHWSSQNAARGWLSSFRQLKSSAFGRSLSRPPARGGRGKGFEGLLPPCELQVRGNLGWHWQSWKELGAEHWTVEVLHSGY